MKLYLIEASCSWYDSYNSAIVAAKDEEDAKTIHPDGSAGWSTQTWVDKPEQVTATLVGTPIRGTKRGVILASFNAG